MRSFNERLEACLADVHRWSAAAWIVGALLAPPLEGGAYAALLPIALIRFHAFAELLAKRWRVRLVLLSYAALLSWAFVSLSWAPVGTEGKLHVRTMIVPFLVVHAALTRQVMVWALFWPGAIWSAILVATWAGLPVPSFIQPDHPSRAALGLAMLGCVAFSSVADRDAASGLLKGCLGTVVWFTGAAIASSRAGVVAVLGGALVGATLTRRSVGHAVRTMWPLATVLAVVAAAMMWTPLGSKIAAYWSRFAGPSVVHGTIADRLDAALSSRLGLWDWTLTASSHVFVGHGARSWPHDFQEAIAAGVPRVSLVTRIDPAAGVLDHAHSVLLQVMYEQGLVGVVLLIGFIVTVGEVAWSVRVSKVGLLFIVAFTAIVIMSLAEGALLTRASATALTILIALVSVDTTATEPG